MYDLVLAHDFGVILTEDEYSDYKLGPNFWFKQGRPIKPYHRIRISRIIKDSPLVLEVVLASIGGIWVLLQIIEKIQNWIKGTDLDIQSLVLSSSFRESQEARN